MGSKLIFAPESPQISEYFKEIETSLINAENLDEEALYNKYCIRKPIIRYTKTDIIHDVEGLVYNIPVDGNIDLLEYRPSTLLYSHIKTYMKNGVISYTIPSLSSDKKSLVTSRHQSILQQNVDNWSREVDVFNRELREVYIPKLLKIN